MRNNCLKDKLLLFQSHQAQEGTMGVINMEMETEMVTQGLKMATEMAMEMEMGGQRMEMEMAMEETIKEMDSRRMETLTKIGLEMELLKDNKGSKTNKAKIKRLLRVLHQIR